MTFKIGVSTASRFGLAVWAIRTGRFWRFGGRSAHVRKSCKEVDCRGASPDHARRTFRQGVQEQDHVILLEIRKGMGEAESAVAGVYEDAGHAVLLGFTENEQRHAIRIRPRGQPSVYCGTPHSSYARVHVNVSILIFTIGQFTRIVNCHES